MGKENALEHVTSVEHDDDHVAASADKRLARISVLLGPDEGRTFKFADECTIGRSAEASVRLPDRGVSRLHVRLRRVTGDRFLIEDLSSRNGTLVDGRRVTSLEIGSGARIQIGPRCLLLLSVHDELEESLTQAKKMEIIGRLSAGINHDFNNLLCVVLANAAYMLELPRNITLAHVEVRECLEDMRSAAQAGAELTSRLATLVQGGPFVHEVVDLSRLCQDVLGVLRNTFPRSVRIEPRVQPGIVVHGIRAHLWQLVLNPALNARDAMPDGGTLAIEVVLKSADELDSPPAVRASSYAVITFDDTGRGMSSEVLKSAFEPFFTTKEIDLGRGLGLATVRKVASEHGGTVHLSSQAGKGTTLRVVLPLAELSGEDLDAGQAQPKITQEALSVDFESGEAAAESIAGALEVIRRRVLVAEDDRALARAFARALRRAGYDVLLAENGAQALETYERNMDTLDLLLLDLDMPDARMHGVFTTIRARSPELPVVMLTDAPEQDAGGAPRSESVDIVLHKPVDPGVLARVVSRAIRRRGSKP